MALWGQPQWSTVGDTFPVGCKFSEDIVFSEFLKLNPDFANPKYKCVAEATRTRSALVRVL